MNGNSILLDTNIVLYFLAGDDTLLPLFEENNLVISIISEIEILGYHGLRGKELDGVKSFLNQCTIINITTAIKEQTISIRRKYNLRIPDSIIMATSQNLDIPLITADSDFKKVKSGNIIFYENG